ncbi:MAG TPA: PAS domain S-box protein [Herpetosiphonaceae bacterium]|nr:PAS domain S-box protein [Herpetosiphonaceae bacterium]
MLTTVKVPPELEPMFMQAQEYVSRYFNESRFLPSQGTIEIFGQRYILVRSASMSIEFFDIIKNLYQDKGTAESISIARNLLFDLAHAIGIADARNFHSQLNLSDPIEKLSVGPIHFAHTGWAFVDISPDSRPAPDDTFYLRYDHPHSFEASSWIQSGVPADFPVCVMNAGYSSGWCEESFGVPLVTIEIMCQAMGHDQCRFIMAHPSKIEEFVKEYCQSEQSTSQKITNYEIPGFFNRKNIESELIDREEQYRSIFEAANDAFIILDMDGMIVEANYTAHHMYGYEPQAMIGFPVQKLFNDGDTIFAQFRTAVAMNEHFHLETTSRTRDGTPLDVEVRGKMFGYRRRQHFLATIRDISERKRAEAEKIRLSTEINTLSTPLIPLGSRVVLMPLIGRLDTQRMHQVIETLLKGIALHHAHIAILDITGVPIVDEDVANALLQATRTAQLIGTSVIFTGIRPEVAQAMVALGLDLASINTHSTLEQGIQVALQNTNASPHHQ